MIDAALTEEAIERLVQDGAVLLKEAFSRELAGTGRWVPRDGLGTFPIRFPVDDAPDDDGWHIESTGTSANGDAIVDPASREATPSPRNGSMRSRRPVCQPGRDGRRRGVPRS